MSFPTIYRHRIKLVCSVPLYCLLLAIDAFGVTVVTIASTSLPYILTLHAWTCTVDTIYVGENAEYCYWHSVKVVSYTCLYIEIHIFNGYRRSLSRLKCSGIVSFTSYSTTSLYRYTVHLPIVHVLHV